jgi:tetraacyldisaccharide 4'-kinase
LKQAQLRGIISGKYEGAYAAFVRLAFCPFSFVYLCAVQTRNKFYDSGTFKTHKVSAPVISVGNITAGGTGKTPLVVWLAKYISSKGKRCAILTRGYKAGRDPVDEPALLARSAEGTPVIINPDRIGAAKEAIKNGAEVLILDDAFQHRRLARKLDIVTIDATCPFGGGRILPAGLLREPIQSLERAGAVIITRADQVDETSVEEIKKTILSVNPSLAIATAAHKPVSIKNSSGDNLPLSSVKNKKVLTFCGIGNPDAFKNTVNSLGASVTKSMVFDDHYHYTQDDIARISDEAKTTNAELVLTTEKDFNKINGKWLEDKPDKFAYLTVEMELLSGREVITQLIDETIAGKITQAYNS